MNAMKTLKEREAKLDATKLALKKITEAAQPIADMVEPPAEGVNPRPLSETLLEVPAKFTGYVQKIAELVSKQFLAFVKSFYLQADLAPVAEWITEDCFDEQFHQYLQEMGPIAKEVASHLDLEWLL